MRILFKTILDDEANVRLITNGLDSEKIDLAFDNRRFTIKQIRQMARCRKCNRVLKNPVAIKLGIGPVCARKEQLERGTNQQNGDTDQIVAYDGGNFWIERIAAPTLVGPNNETAMKTHTASGVRSNVQRQIYKHSPTGYNFGYGGSGPADFALNLCLMLVHSDDAYHYYQSFKFQFVAVGDSNAERLEIPRTEAEEWFRGRGVKLLSE